MEICKRNVNAVQLLSSFVSKDSDDRDASNNKDGKQQCSEPRNRQAFLKRVLSFTSMRWFAKPTWLSPLECSRYGWENVDVDILQCVSCKMHISGRMPASENPKSYDDCCARLKISLQSGHSLACPWASSPSPEYFLHLPYNTRPKALRAFSENVKHLVKLGQQLPLIPESTLDTVCLNPVLMMDVLRCSSGSFQEISKEESDAAALMAITGWTTNDSDAKSARIHCTMCNRDIGMWNFLTVCNPIDTASNEPEEDTCNAISETDDSEQGKQQDEVTQNEKSCMEKSDDETGPQTPSNCASLEVGLPIQSSPGQQNLTAIASITEEAIETSCQSRFSKDVIDNRTDAKEDDSPTKTLSSIEASVNNPPILQQVPPTDSVTDKGEKDNEIVGSKDSGMLCKEENMTCKPEGNSECGNGSVIHDHTIDASNSNMNCPDKVELEQTLEKSVDTDEGVMDAVLSPDGNQLISDKQSEKSNKRPEELTDEPAAKRQKLEVPGQTLRKKHKRKKTSFLPLSEHHPWCPWVSRSGDQPGWQQMLYLLLPQLNSNKNTIMPSQANMSSPEVLRSIRKLFNEWTSPDASR